MTDEPQEPLRRLEERLSRASEAAERLISEAARTREPGRPPPAGWQAPGQQEPASGERRGSELESLMQAIQALRELIPAEVLERIMAAIREVLLALRSLIDFYLDRLERKPEEPVEVQEIPIE
jgi:hypothetical protein